MTEAVLVSIISTLCGGSVNTTVRSPEEIKEMRIACYEEYTNCAVTLKGIMSLQDFTKKCVKK